MQQFNVTRWLFVRRIEASYATPTANANVLQDMALAFTKTVKSAAKRMD